MHLVTILGEWLKMMDERNRLFRDARRQFNNSDGDKEDERKVTPFMMDRVAKPDAFCTKMSLSGVEKVALDDRWKTPILDIVPPHREPISHSFFMYRIVHFGEAYITYRHLRKTMRCPSDSTIWRDLGGNFSEDGISLLSEITLRSDPVHVGGDFFGALYLDDAPQPEEANCLRGIEEEVFEKSSIEEICGRCPYSRIKAALCHRARCFLRYREGHGYTSLPLLLESLASDALLRFQNQLHEGEDEVRQYVSRFLQASTDDHRYSETARGRKELPEIMNKIIDDNRIAFASQNQFFSAIRAWEAYKYEEVDMTALWVSRSEKNRRLALLEMWDPIIQEAMKKRHKEELSSQNQIRKIYPYKDSNAKQRRLRDDLILAYYAREHIRSNSSESRKPTWEKTLEYVIKNARDPATGELVIPESKSITAGAVRKRLARHLGIKFHNVLTKDLPAFRSLDLDPSNIKSYNNRTITALTHIAQDYIRKNPDSTEDEIYQWVTDHATEPGTDKPLLMYKKTSKPPFVRSFPCDRYWVGDAISAVLVDLGCSIHELAEINFDAYEGPSSHKSAWDSFDDYRKWFSEWFAENSPELS